MLIPAPDVLRWKRPHVVLSIYGLSASFGAVLAAASILRITTDPKNSVFLGFSWQRLGLLSLTLLLAILLAVFALWTFRDQARAMRLWQKIFNHAVLREALRWGSLVIFLFAGIAALVPSYRYGAFQDYFIRLYPFVLWLTFFGGMTALVAFVETRGLYWETVRQVILSRPKMLRDTAVVFAGFLAVWILIALTGVGITSVEFEDHWYETGVPVLVGQILLAFGAGIAMFHLERTIPGRHWVKLDRILCVGIWITAAILWIREPLPPSFLAPGPYLPNREYYPYSDASIYDLGSQYALIGQGLNNGVFYDHALYMAFLLFLHTLAGQKYAQVVALQATLYAVFPVILYLLLKAIKGRPAGIILAVLATLRGVSGIAASTLLTSTNQKHMLTDFPTAIGVALVVFLTVVWLNNLHRFHYMFWVGGAIGLLTLLRTNALFLWPFIVMLVLLVYRPRWLWGAGVSVLLTVVMLASVLPWGMQSRGSFLDVYLLKIRTVIRSRWRYMPPPSPIPPGRLSPLYPVAYVPGSQALAPVTWESNAFATETHRVDFFEHSTPVRLQSGGTQSTLFPAFVSTHFFHNIVTSVLILPTSPFLHDLRSTIKEVNTYWQQYWDGTISLGAGIFLAFNLLLIAVGLSAATERAGLAGLIPLGIFLSYDLANAFARTSGGRYIVPIDWIILVYFVLGSWQMIEWGLALFGTQTHLSNVPAGSRGDFSSLRWSWRSGGMAAGIIVFFLSIGASLPLSGNFFSQRYTSQSKAEILAYLEQRAYYQEMGLSLSDLQTFLAQPAAVALNGRALYPRYYSIGKGEPRPHYPYLVLDFPRLAFILIGPEGTRGIIFPREKVRYFPNAVDVIVLGCKEDGYIDALAVVVEGDETAAYVRQPPSPLQCPLQQPVCDLNRICH